MELSELRSSPHISASGIGDYTDCGLLYRLSRIDRFPREFIPDSLVFGSAIHRVMEEFNQARICGDEFDETDFEERFEHHWTKETSENGEIRYSKSNNAEILLAQGKAMLAVYCRNPQQQTYTVIAAEEPFAFMIEGMEIPVIGAIDLIEEDESGTLIIADYKTLGKAWSAGQVDSNFQMTVYQMAAEAMGYGDRNILLRLDCLIKTKTPKFVQYYTTRTEKELNRAKKKIVTVWEGIRRGVFIPNETGWKCGYCTYKTYCEQWFDGGL